MRRGDRDDLARRPHAQGIAERLRDEVAVAAEREQPAGVVEELAHGDALAVGDQPGQPALDGVLERESLLGDELQDDGGDERLGDTADAEAVACAHPGLGLQLAVAAREADRPVSVADEQHRARHTGGDNLIQARAEASPRGRPNGRRAALADAAGAAAASASSASPSAIVVWVLVMSRSLSWCSCGVPDVWRAASARPPDAALTRTGARAGRRGVRRGGREGSPRRRRPRAATTREGDERSEG